MEKNGRITLIDKELSEGQQKLSRFIEYYTHIPFTGETYNEWSMWVALNKEYAEHEKAKQTDQKSEEDKPVKKYKNRDRKRGREIAVNADSLYGAIKSIGETNGHICALCGFGHAYLSDVKRRGWMYESDIEKLSDAGIDAADYVTDEWYRAKYLTEEEPVVVKTVTQTSGTTPQLSDPVTVHPVNEFMDVFKYAKTGFYVQLDAEDMELIRVLSKAKSVSETEVCEGIIREQLDGIRLMIAEM